MLHMVIWTLNAIIWANAEYIHKNQHPSFRFWISSVCSLIAFIYEMIVIFGG